jgi:hypothetical protein
VDAPLSDVFKDKVEAEGDRTWGGMGEVDFGGGIGGPKVLPLPSTLPPPMVRLDIALGLGFHEAEGVDVSAQLW